MAQRILTMFLPVALILLSAAASGQNVKRCYWCGPLAEQVHRSQRAPSCGPELEETICDPGYTHCAVVATSPPYIESRLCVKFYQDECYSLYCNSSKTWRMICPCQGDLCNGQNTDRETRAFATLAKIVGKNKRSKRYLIGAKGFIPLTPRNKVVSENNTIPTIPSPENEANSAMSEETTGEHIETTIMTDLLEEHKSENDIDNNIYDTNQDNESEMQGDQPIEVNVITATTEDNADETADSKDVDETEAANNEQSETTKITEDIKINNVESTMAIIEENIDDKPTVTIHTEFAKIEDTTEIPSLTSMIPISIQIELSVIQIKNLNDNLPPPEALQQNVTPAQITTPTTIGTVEIVTTNQIETTTQPIKEVTKKIEKPQEIKKNKEKDEKNGDDQTLVYLWELVVLMNIIIYITL